MYKTFDEWEKSKPHRFWKITPSHNLSFGKYCVEIFDKLWGEIHSSIGIMGFGNTFEEALVNAQKKYCETLLCHQQRPIHNFEPYITNIYKIYDELMNTGLEEEIQRWRNYTAKSAESKRNAGIICDTEDGLCARGAWHHKNE